MASIIPTLQFIARHPLSSQRPLAAFWRYARWQIESRLRNEVEFDWVNGAKLVVRRGMTGATGNIYCGLHEFEDMGFLLHLLRPGGLFVDVGANIGSYTILASAVCGADVIAFEPDPDAAGTLRRNVDVNNITDRVKIYEAGVGAHAGVARLTVGNDTTNRIVHDGSAATREVAIQSLDDVLADKNPTLIKIDVEGHEPEVIKGAEQTLKKTSLKAIIIETVTDEIEEAIVGSGLSRAYYDPNSRILKLGSQNADQFKSTGNSLFIRENGLSDHLASAEPKLIAGISL